MASISVVSRRPLILLKTALKIAAPITVALLPKCGLCVVAYLNLFSLMGLSVFFVKYFEWFLPVLIAAIAIHLCIAYIKAKRKNDYRLFILQVSGIVILLSGRMILFYPVLTWTGAAIIFMVSILQVINAGATCNRNIKTGFLKKLFITTKCNPTS